MKLIALLALLCIGMYASAQLQYSFKAGAQLSTARYTRNGEKVSTGSIAGFNAGILAKVYFDDKVAFVTGLCYSQRGFKVSTLPGDTLKTYHLNYADIPVMIQVDFQKRGAGFYCKFGPTLGIGLSGKEIYTGMNGQQIRNKAILSITGNHFGLFDASMNAGLGYAFAKRFFAEANYAYGIGNIDNDPDGPNIKTRVVSLSMGYSFR
jgi:hypothetical protein